MVYNAMKKFMEINPQLFDECSHDYNERQNSAEQREKARLNRWDKLAELAKDRRNGIPAPPVKTASTDAAAAREADDVDATTEESRSQLNSLKLQDESSPGKERKKVRDVSQNPVSGCL